MQGTTGRGPSSRSGSRAERRLGILLALLLAATFGFSTRASAIPYYSGTPGNVAARNYGVARDAGASPIRDVPAVRTYSVARDAGASPIRDVVAVRTYSVARDAGASPIRDVIAVRTYSVARDAGASPIRDVVAITESFYNDAGVRVARMMAQAAGGGSLAATQP